MRTMTMRPLIAAALSAAMLGGCAAEEATGAGTAPARTDGAKSEAPAAGDAIEAKPALAASDATMADLIALLNAPLDSPPLLADVAPSESTIVTAGERLEELAAAPDIAPCSDD
jgi:hypothetical protein